MTVLRDWQAKTPLIKTEDGWRQTLVWTADSVASESAAFTAVNSYVISTEGVAAGINIKAPHPDTSYMQVVGTSTTELAPNNYFQVEVTYETPTSNNTGGNPFQSPGKYEWANVTETVQIEEDIDGNPIVNSALDPYDQPPTITETFKQLTITRNEPYFNLQQSIAYEGKVNSDTVYLQGVGAGKLTAGQIKCISILPNGPLDLDDNFVSVSYVFWIREDGFQLRRMDIGYRQFVAGDEKSKPIQDQNGDDITTPVPLNGEGLQYGNTDDTGRGLPPGIVGGGAGDFEDTGTAVFFTYTVHESKNFGDLRLFGPQIA